MRICSRIWPASACQLPMCAKRSFTDQPSGKYPDCSLSAGVRDSVSPMSSDHPVSSARISSRLVAIASAIIVPSPWPRTRSSIVLGEELERGSSDHHLVAPPRSGLLEPALHAGPYQSSLQIDDLPGVLQVCLGHPSLDPGAGHAEPGTFLADHERLSARAKDHVRLRRWLLGPGFGDHPADPPRQLLDPFPRHTRDGEVDLGRDLRRF